MSCPVLPEALAPPCPERPPRLLPDVRERTPDNCRTTPDATTATPDATSATLDATFATRLSVPRAVEVAFFAEVERRPDVLRVVRDFVLALRAFVRPPRFFVEALLARDFVADAERRLTAGFRPLLFFFDPLLRAAMVYSPFCESRTH